VDERDRHWLMTGVVAVGFRRTIEQQAWRIDPDRRWSIRWPICRLAAARENLDDHHPAATARVCGTSRAPSLGRCTLHGAVRAISERL